MNMRTNGVTRRLLPALAAVAMLGACGGGTESALGTDTPAVLPVLPLSPALVSEPAPRVSPAAGVAYVSMPPGGFPTGDRATIRNPANGSRQQVQLVQGGWDPVPIAAEPGDTLRITVTTAGGETLEYVNPVPPLRPPTILRTDPQTRKRDVALNAVIVVVFSEPIDPATLTPARVQLLQGGAPQAATIELSADGLRITVRPQGGLVAGTDYRLVVSRALEDVTGDGLELDGEVEFSTLPESAPAAGILAFQRGATVFSAILESGETVQLATGASRPVWSPDASRLAFTRPADNAIANWQLCIANSDGTNSRCVTGQEAGNVAGGPSWSPDGERVAFSIYRMCQEAICTDGFPYFSSLSLLDTRTMRVETLATPPVWSASWSPDGRKIAIALFREGTYGRGALATVNPDGSGLKFLALSFGTYSVNRVEWSPTGERLALILNDEHACPWYCDTVLGVVDPDGTGLTILDRASEAAEVYFWYPPAWSPDGTHLAYTVSRGGACFMHDASCNEIVAMSVSGGPRRMLMPRAASPSWR